MGVMRIAGCHQGRGDSWNNVAMLSANLYTPSSYFTGLCTVSNPSVGSLATVLVSSAGVEAALELWKQASASVKHRGPLCSKLSVVIVALPSCMIVMQVRRWRGAK